MTLDAIHREVPVEASPEHVKGNPVLKNRLDNVRILIVDAEPADYLSVLTGGNRPATHWQVYRSGTDALQSANAEGAHLCLINTRLPDMSGLELYRILRPRLRVIPVVFVADRYRRDDELAALSTGTVHFACKPLEATFLEKILSAPTASPRDVAPLRTKQLDTTTGAEP